VSVVVDIYTDTNNVWNADGTATSTTTGYDNSGSNSSSSSSTSYTYNSFTLADGTSIVAAQGESHIIMGAGGSIAQADVYNPDNELLYQIRIDDMQTASFTSDGTLRSGTSTMTQFNADMQVVSTLNGFTSAANGGLLSHGTFDIITGAAMITTNGGNPLEVVRVPGFGLLGYGFRNGTTRTTSGSVIGRWVTQNSVNFAGHVFETATIFTTSDGVVDVFIGSNQAAELTGLMINFVGGTVSGVNPDTHLITWGGFYYNDGVELSLFEADINVGLDWLGAPFSTRAILLENGTASTRNGDILWQASSVISQSGLLRETSISSVGQQAVSMSMSFLRDFNTYTPYDYLTADNFYLFDDIGENEGVRRTRSEFHYSCQYIYQLQALIQQTIVPIITCMRMMTL